nr:hypothetical protein Iba_chr08dCG14590 [Ipomoea batatas]
MPNRRLQHHFVHHVSKTEPTLRPFEPILWCTNGNFEKRNLLIPGIRSYVESKWPRRLTPPEPPPSLKPFVRCLLRETKEATLGWLAHKPHLLYPLAKTRTLGKINALNIRQQAPQPAASNIGSNYSPHPQPSKPPSEPAATAEPTARAQNRLDRRMRLWDCSEHQPSGGHHFRRPKDNQTTVRGQRDRSWHKQERHGLLVPPPLSVVLLFSFFDFPTYLQPAAADKVVFSESSQLFYDRCSVQSDPALRHQNANYSDPNLQRPFHRHFLAIAIKPKQPPLNATLRDDTNTPCIDFCNVITGYCLLCTSKQWRKQGPPSEVEKNHSLQISAVLQSSSLNLPSKQWHQWLLIQKQLPAPASGYDPHRLG